MTDRRPLCTITATDAAARALDRLSAENGPLVLHITAGGSDSGAPVCLAASELSLGPRDVYLGTVQGVDVFEMRSHENRHFRDGSFVVDVSRGLPSGFSLAPDDGLRFVLRGSEVGGRDQHGQK
ncbi:DUF779 domain-containing protein [Jatrophihabitans endophyticus]|uniref:DUF779 domain-containing protein n=1 Tax=Jatrophihabitans endophyticus TaxID=1206085 RepID=UPI001A08FFFA|nr:DUF779 domain-containing protein [Jatrophihabitans endophyticus]MBE7189334.1 DUF779 domain-containing protein [Jatrophihabitans endophyticus]